MKSLFLTQPADQPFFHLDEIEGETCGMVATVWSSNRSPEAYANLFASAPELLSNLRYAVKLLNGLPAFRGTAQIEHMEAVIAKATGETA